MMQGDSYNLEIEILDAAGVPITDQMVADVEITIGFLCKKYSDNDGGVTYSTDVKKWLFKVEQEESFKLPATGVKSQVRVKWPEGGVVGIPLGRTNIHESISKEVL